MSSNAVTKSEGELVARQEVNVLQVTPLQIFAKAMDKGIPLEQIKELREMVEWHDKREAEKAFNAAMSKFRSEAITIAKNKRVGYETKEGGSVGYSHATLDAVVDAAVPKLSEHGLSHRWETQQENGQITVTCVITHRDGHSQRTSLSAAPDNSGKKNSIQAIGSTVSYLERYTFMAATGLAAKGMDDDGKGAGSATITEEQIANLEALISEVGANKAAFLKACKIDELAHMQAEKYDGAVQRLKAKRSRS